MEKMTLIIFGKTGHVLGAVIRTADPGSAVDPKALVGDGIYLRDPVTGVHWITVEPQHLKVEIVDRIDQVLLAPWNYVLADGVPEETNVLDNPIGLDGTNVTVKLPNNASEDIEAWVQIEGGPSDDSVLRKIEIAEGSDVSVLEPMTLADGTYRVLAMVPGYRASTGETSVPPPP